jgi:hypothetical protein
VVNTPGEIVNLAGGGLVCAGSRARFTSCDWI